VLAAFANARIDIDALSNPSSTVRAGSHGISH
jgi:hypothetical protein